MMLTTVSPPRPVALPFSPAKAKVCWCCRTYLHKPVMGVFDLRKQLHTRTEAYHLFGIISTEMEAAGMGET